MNIDVSSDTSVMRNVNYYAGTLTPMNSSWSPSEDDLIKGNFHDWPLKEMHDMAPFEELKPLSASFILIPTTGYVVSILSAHHKLFDADSAIRLFANWASLTKDLLSNDVNGATAEAGETSLSVPFPMTFDRSPILEMEERAKVCFKTSHIDNHQQQRMPMSDEDETDMKCQSIGQQEKIMAQEPLDISSQVLSQFRFRFLKSDIDKHKAVATAEMMVQTSSSSSSSSSQESNLNQPTYLTRNDILCANLWQSCVRACLTCGGEDIGLVPAGSCFFPCNLRGKTINPTIEGSYIGNGLVLANAVFTSQNEVDANPTLAAERLVSAPLFEVARCIRKEVLATMVSEVGVMKMGMWADEKNGRGLPTYPGFIISSWCQCDLYQVDFGIGVPMMASSVQLPAHPNLAYVTRSPPSQFITKDDEEEEEEAIFDVCITLPEKLVKVIIQDRGNFDF